MTDFNVSINQARKLRREHIINEDRLRKVSIRLENLGPMIDKIRAVQNAPKKNVGFKVLAPEKLSELGREGARISLLSPDHISKKIFTCPSCHKTGKGPMMKYHIANLICQKSPPTR